MIDPAVIVLILTGFFTLVLVIIGAMLGRKRYVESRYAILIKPYIFHITINISQNIEMRFLF